MITTSEELPKEIIDALKLIAAFSKKEIEQKLTYVAELMDKNDCRVCIEIQVDRAVNLNETTP